MKVWYQSLTELDALPEYRHELAVRVAAASPDDVRPDIVGLASGTYPEGPPIASLILPAGRERVGRQVVDNAIAAQAQGFDAILIGSFVAPGLRSARSAVDIPVISMAESCVLASRIAARSVRMLALNADQGGLLRELLVELGLGGLSIEIRHLALRDERELSSAIADPADLVRRVEAACGDLGDSEADLIIPGEGVLAAVLGSAGVVRILDRPVMDVFAVALAETAAAGALFARGALAHGRHVSYPAISRSV